MKRTTLLKRSAATFMMFMLTMALFAQGRTVTGTIIDPLGDPVIGANVVEKGTTNGSITDMDGKFSIKVASDKSVISVSYIGYLTFESAVGTQPVLNITLKEDSQSLEEIVVVGYGVQKKRDLSGAISSIKAKDVIAIPTTNALESLQGKVAGIDLTKSSGKAGESISFTVRGERSLKASNQPLVIVDGIDYGTNLDINPSDIESIEVLKDASSTAIYGTRGANGIIIVTTKKGKAGKSRVTLNSYVSANMIASYPDIMNGEQYAQLKREAYRDQTTNQYLPDNQVFTAAKELEYVQNGTWTNFRDLLMKNGFDHNHELSISGGSEKTQFNLSFGYHSEKGLFNNDNYDRYNSRLVLDHQLYSNFKIGTTLAFTFKDQNTRRDPLNQANKIVPLAEAYDETGTVIPYPAPGYSSQMNPLLDDVPGALQDNTKDYRFFGTLFANWNITKDLLFRTTLGVDANNFRRGYFTAAQTLDGEDKDSKSQKEHTTLSNITWENVLTYSKIWGDHDFQAMGGTSTIYKGKEYTSASGKGQTYDGNIYHNLASNTKEVMIGSYLTEEQLASFFGRVNYKFKDRYILTASLRADGSSVLAPGRKWGYFPSVALAWRINDEAFLKEIEQLSNLKLRLSWGESGQSAIDPYQTIGLLGTATYTFNNALAAGLYPKSMSNKLLTWETTSAFNLGLDFGFFNNRLTGAVDVYKTFTRNILMNRIIPSTNGYTEVMENIGKTENTGVDLSLNSVNIQNKDFSWNTDFTLSHNKEKIVELASGAMKDEANAWFVGESFRVFYDYRKEGIWQKGEEEEAKKNGQVPGDIKIWDKDGDGQITTDDRDVFTKRPSITLGLNNSFSYRNFELSFFIYGRFGQWIDYEYYRGYKPDGLENGSNVNYWTPENPSNDFPRPNRFASFAKTRYSSSLKYADGSFWKIRDITFGYTLPKKATSALKLERLRFYMTAKNFFTFSGLDGYDPERGGGLSFPMTKQVIFGLNLEF